MIPIQNETLKDFVERLPELTVRWQTADDKIADKTSQATATALTPAGEPRGGYNGQEDVIVFPEGTKFSTPDECRIFLHEIVHWSGKRLSRASICCIKKWGDPAYALEELCAELGACLLLSALNISDTLTKESHDYLDNWMAPFEGPGPIADLIQELATHEGRKAMEYLIDLAGLDFETMRLARLEREQLKAVA